VGTIVAFRVGAQDLKTLNTEFMLGENDQSLIKLNPHHALLRTDDLVEHLTMPNIEYERFGLSEQIISQSRKCYSMPRNLVEHRINKFVRNTK
jgi:hypothetical protein